MSHSYAEPTQGQQRETAASHFEAHIRPHPAARPVSCAVSPGQPQGGLIDWFRSKFGTQAEQQPQDEGPQWEREEYGQVNPEYVTDQPAPDSPLASIVTDYAQEGPGQAPVFETHSFMPRQAVDNEGAGHLHSFIGLRFTQLDPITSRYTRKRLKVGFGGNGSPFSDHGVLMDDNNTQADMSSETPITRQQLETAFGVIPQKANEPYNVLTHNCNHFTQSIAALVGASVPAKLHDTILGPMTAYKNLANAAQDGQQSRTRFFQGGGLGWRNSKSQMAAGRNRVLMEDFEDTARSAARWDGLPFLLYPSLKNAAKQVAQAAAPMRQFLSDFSPESSAETDALEQTTRDVSEKANALIHLRLWKGHPRVNIAAMKVIAIAEQLHSTFLPEQRTLTSYSQQELEASLNQPTQAERDAAVQYNQAVRIAKHTHREDTIPSLDRGVSNEQLFSSNNTQLVGAGDIFLQAMGIQPRALLRQHSGTDEGLMDRNLALLRQVSQTLTGEDGVGVNTYLTAFFQGRDNLTDAQLGALAAQAVLDALLQAASQSGSSLARSLVRTRITTGLLAKSRKNDSLDNDSDETTQNLILGFTGVISASSSERQRQETEKRRQVLDLFNVIEATFATKFEAVRARAAAGADSQAAPEGQQ